MALFIRNETHEKENVLGIASLILIIGVAGVYFMLQPKPGPEPEKKFIVPSEADLKQVREGKKSLSVSEVVKPPPSGASSNGHWHNGEWHDTTHKPISYTRKGMQLTYEEALKQAFKEQREFAEKIVTERMEDFMKVARKGATYNLTKKDHEILQRLAPLIHEKDEMYNRLKAGYVMSNEELKHFFALTHQIRKISQEIHNVWEGYDSEVDRLYNEILAYANWEGYEAEVNKVYKRGVGKPENIITKEEYYRRMEEQSNEN